PLRIARLTHLERRRDVDLDEPLSQLLARGVAVRAERRDERGDYDRARVDEEPRDLGDAPDVLRPVLGPEAEIGVEPVPDVVAVEHVGERAALDQPALEPVRERR